MSKLYTNTTDLDVYEKKVSDCEAQESLGNYYWAQLVSLKHLRKDIDQLIIGDNDYLETKEELIAVIKHYLNKSEKQMKVMIKKYTEKALEELKIDCREKGKGFHVEGMEEIQYDPEKTTK